MLKNYFIVAWRNLFRSKSSSVINIGGLAAGMAVALLIGLWINDELSFNHYHTHYDRIARMMQIQSRNGQRDVQQSMPFPIGPGLRSNYAATSNILLCPRGRVRTSLGQGERRLSITGIYMDKEAPAMLSLRMLKGR
jgi:putative ABC transport system permease protein